VTARCVGSGPTLELPAVDGRPRVEIGSGNRDYRKQTIRVDLGRGFDDNVLDMNYLYLATCRKNGKQYVGVTNTTVAARWRNHCWFASRGGQLALQRGLRKHGVANFTIETIWSTQSREDVHAAEIALIEALGTVVPGVEAALAEVAGVRTDLDRERTRADRAEGVIEGMKAAASAPSGFAAWWRSVREAFRP
jgi:hypothetical protein